MATVEERWASMSPRVKFQVKYFSAAVNNTSDPLRLQVLNVGSADDPLGFGTKAMHVDLDDWSKKLLHFRQANAERLPFPDRSYHTVILGDILEHVVKWEKAVIEACRVSDFRVVLTIFEEWRLPGHGQHIHAGQMLGDVETRKLDGGGVYSNREDYHRQHYPERVGVSDDAIPHLIHINQFDDGDVARMLKLMEEAGFVVKESLKVVEGVTEGHPWHNWLIMAERKEDADGTQETSQESAGEEGAPG